MFLFYSQFGTLLDADIFTVNVDYILKSLVARFCTAIAINFRGWVWTWRCGDWCSGLSRGKRRE